MISLPPSPRILIVLLGSIGDVTRALCLPGLIKAKYPKSFIAWLVEPTSSSLVKQISTVDRVIVFDRSQPLNGFREVVKECKEHAFDVSIDLQRHFKSGYFSWSSGSAIRLGFHRNNAKEFNWLFSTHTIPFADQDQKPKLDFYLQFLDLLGVPYDRSALSFGLDRVVLSDSISASLKNLNKPYISLVLGSSWESKNWLPQGYLQLSERIRAELGLGVVLLGDKTQTSLAETVSKRFDSKEVLNLVGKTSLIDVTAVLKESILAIGPDSGPGHIAAAVSVPYVSLFGPTSPERTAPYGAEDLVVRSKVACSPCYRRSCPGLGKVCMRLISVEAVLDKVRPLLSERVNG